MKYVKGQSGNPKGKPKGAVSKPQIRDYFTVEEVKDLVESLKIKAKTDEKVAQFLAEHIFGKASQNLTLGEDGSGFEVNLTINQK
jgi:hypothetical protein